MNVPNNSSNDLEGNIQPLQIVQDNLPNIEAFRSRSDGGDSKIGSISSKSFRVIIFSILCLLILISGSTAYFLNKMATPEYMNIISNLLFVCAPSPLDSLLKRKKKEN